MKRTAFPRGGEQDLTPLEFREVNTQVLEEHERGEKDLSPPSKKLKIARIPFLAHSVFLVLNLALIDWNDLCWRYC